MKLPALLTHVQRDRLISRIHRVRIKRLLIGAAFIGLGTIIPEIHGHEVLHAVAADTIKGVGYIPVLKLVEDGDVMSTFDLWVLVCLIIFWAALKPSWFRDH